MDQSSSPNSWKNNNYQDYNINCNKHQLIQRMNWNPSMQQYNQQNNHQQYNDQYSHYRSPIPQQQVVKQQYHHQNQQQYQMLYPYTQQCHTTATVQVQQHQPNQKVSPYLLPNNQYMQSTQSHDPSYFASPQTPQEAKEPPKQPITVQELQKELAKHVKLSDDWWECWAEHFHVNHFMNRWTGPLQTKSERLQKFGKMKISKYFIIECQYGDTKIQLHVHYELPEEFFRVGAVNVYMVTNKDFTGHAQKQSKGESALARKRTEYKTEMEDVLWETGMMYYY